MATAFCLALSILGALASVVLLVVSFRRDDGMLGLAGMSAMLLGAVPAAVYGALTS
jgi:hypothetical protein